jgi:hypothetical protein
MEAANLAVTDRLFFTNRRLSEIWRELALHYFWAECFGHSQLGGDGQIVMTFRRLSQIWRELALHYFPGIFLEASNLMVTDRLFLRTAGYLRFSGNWHYIIVRQIVLGSIFFRLEIFLALVLGTN